MTTKSKKNAKTTKKAAKQTDRRSVMALAWQRVYTHNALKGTCNDAIAVAMNKATKNKEGRTDLALLVKVGKKNGVDVMGRWGKLNTGMVSMNLANVLRGKEKRGEAVTF